MCAYLDPLVEAATVPSGLFAPTRNRVFLTYGRTNEPFCLPSGVEVRFEKVIHSHLQRHGYELIVFFSNRGCFFLDPQSQDAVMLGESFPSSSGNSTRTERHGEPSAAFHRCNSVRAHRSN